MEKWAATAKLAVTVPGEVQARLRMPSSTWIWLTCRSWASVLGLKSPTVRSKLAMTTLMKPFEDHLPFLGGRACFSLEHFWRLDSMQWGWYYGLLYGDLLHPSEWHQQNWGHFSILWRNPEYYVKTELFWYFCPNFNTKKVFPTAFWLVEQIAPVGQFGENEAYLQIYQSTLIMYSITRY